MSKKSDTEGGVTLIRAVEEKYNPNERISEVLEKLKETKEIIAREINYLTELIPEFRRGD